MNNFQSKASLIWNIAELLRWSWKQHEYQDVILPLTVLKRLDESLKNTKQDVLNQYNQFNWTVDVDPILKSSTGLWFYNVSPYDFHKLLDSPSDIAQNLRWYIGGFSSDIQEVIEKFDFEKHISRLSWWNLLYLIIQEFNKIDLSPESVSNHEMWYVFEELIRRFSEQSNETAWEHYTPREVIRLMVDIVFTQDKEELKKPHIVKTIYDPACGTWWMLTTSKDHILTDINPKANIHLHWQELNPVTYGICKSDMLIKWEEAENIKWWEKDHSKASTLSNDQFYWKKFDYMLANPPFGVDWKKDKEAIDRESERGFAGRFWAWLPRTSDWQLMFLQHMISKMRNTSEWWSRIAIVFNGSPLFTWDAWSWESEIRRWILENDWLEAIVALPDQLFYNTWINTYIWILSNKKTEQRKWKVQLIDAREYYKKMRKSLWSKRNEISDEHRSTIHDLFVNFEANDKSKIFKTTDFAFRQITTERPLKLNFQVNEERIEALKTNATYVALAESKKKGDAWVKEIEEGKKLQESILQVLFAMDKQLYKDRDVFIKIFDKVFKDADIKLPANLKKAILSSLSERDEEASICLDSKWNPESDSELRDTENVPYEQDIYEYFEKEVKPFVSDAWIDVGKTDAKDWKLWKVGYEIPVTRYFYKYEAPRDLEEIESDIEKIENELLDMLKEL